WAAACRPSTASACRHRRRRTRRAPWTLRAPARSRARRGTPRGGAVDRRGFSWLAPLLVGEQTETVDGGFDRAPRRLPQTADRRVAHRAAHVAQHRDVAAVAATHEAMHELLLPH